MSQTSKTIHVSIMGKDYPVGCPEGQEEQLLASARYVNEKMQRIRAGSRSVGLDRIAVMAALNIAHELMQLQHQQSQLLNQQSLSSKEESVV
jgi:cell division protein ZapA